MKRVIIVLLITIMTSSLVSCNEVDSQVTNDIDKLLYSNKNTDEGEIDEEELEEEETTIRYDKDLVKEIDERLYPIIEDEEKVLLKAFDYPENGYFNYLDSNNLESDYEKSKGIVTYLYNKYNTSSVKIVEHTPIYLQHDGDSYYEIFELRQDEISATTLNRENSPYSSVSSVSSGKEVASKDSANDYINENRLLLDYFYVYDPNEKISFKESGIEEFIYLLSPYEFDLSELEKATNELLSSGISDTERIVSYSNGTVQLLLSINEEKIYLDLTIFYDNDLEI